MPHMAVCQSTECRPGQSDTVTVDENSPTAMTEASGIGHWLERLARRRGAASALLAPGRAPLGYAPLYEQARSTHETLRRLGIGRGDPVAVMLPNGPEMAAAFVSIAASSPCAPLNPGLKSPAIEFSLRDLRAKALVVAEDAADAARQAAAGAGVPVLRLRRRGSAAGRFELAGGPVAADVSGDAAWASAHDVALLLYTSGTTSRPRLVPLLGRNLLASARSISATLTLQPDDVCLNIMPLFHIHGLMASVMATLEAGAGVVCTDGIYGARFFEWLEEFRPSWYSAVPTMHQAVLRQARHHGPIGRHGRLRLVRSSSASLPASVLHELEDTFGVPVIEAYGMTEASHQIASNPLPPGVRKAGSVGPAAGPEIAVVDENGRRVAPGTDGEVVIRGDTVTPGYVGGREPTEAAVVDGWLRTGDRGRLDEEGYLYLTGRLKELINRGGEKISPCEIDEVLLGHPAVRQALVFAVPHRQLGEEIGAAVELKRAGVADEHELRRYAAKVLPAFKTPRVIRIVDTIPTGPTGKLERSRLAALLDIPELDDEAPSPYLAPRDDIERRVAALWQRLLRVERVGVRDRFMALGGDSLLAVQMLLEVSDAEGVEAPFTRFLEEGTIEALAAELAEARREAPSGLVAIQPAGTRRPLFCVPGHDGVLVGISRLARELGSDRPVWSFRLTEPARDIAELARRCVEQMVTVDGAEPYRLVGICFGGLVAFEMARQLTAAGARVEMLALVDTLSPTWRSDRAASEVLTSIGRQLRAKVAHHGTVLRGMRPRDGVRYLARRVGAFFQNHGETAGARAVGLGMKVSRAPQWLKWTHRRLALDYRPDVYAGHVVVVKLPGRRPDVPALGWDTVVRGILEDVAIPFHPHGALAGRNVARVAEILSRRMG
jgi:acyl-CoA synthetase (AMP-forming)/AMP-acid ligase II/thioesterase domain-containing protein/acyl carrier protein